MLTSSEQAYKWIGDEVYNQMTLDGSNFITAYVMQRKGNYFLVLDFDKKRVERGITAYAWYGLAEDYNIRLREVKPANC